MRLDTWMNELCQSSLVLNFRTKRRRRHRNPGNAGHHPESLEDRLLLTIEVDQPFSAPGGPMAQVSERFDANGSYDLVTLSASGNLTVDHTAPLATLISPAPNVINTGVGNTIVVEFSESVLASSVATLAPWTLTRAGSDGVFGTIDDIPVSLQLATYHAATHRATLVLPAAIMADGSYRLTVEGTNTSTAVVDLSGNRLNNGVNQTFDFIVNSNGPEISAANSPAGNEGQSLTLTATISDAGAVGPHAATVDWGDGTTSTTSVSLTGGSGTLALSHTWTQDGVFSVTICVTDSSGDVATAVVSATIANVNPTLSPLTALTGNEGQSVSLAAAFSDAGLLDSHSATIHWGDGVTTTGNVTFSNGAGSVSGTHVYADNGSYTVNVTVQDESGQLVSRSTTAMIANLAPVIQTVQSMSGNEGASIALLATFSDPGILDNHAATITWSDGSTTAATVTESSGSGTISASHIFGDNGSFAVSIQLMDNDGASAAVVHTATIANVAPTVQAAAAASASVVATFSLATFTDPGFGANGTSETFTAAIN